MSSLVSPAVAALLAKVSAAVAEDVEVYDGPADGRAYAAKSVTVAAAFEQDQNAVAVERAYSGAKPRCIESLDVACTVYVGSGDTDPAAAADLRAEAGAILGGIDAALRADRTLGGVVGMARLETAQWLQGRDAQGAGVMVGFIVSLTSVS